MKILVACEESQRVTIEMRKKGHEAFSCDIIECSGNHLEWHIKQDVLPLINGKCYSFKTSDGESHKLEDGKWDMILAFPPCTHLAVSGARHFEQKRLDGRQREAIEFFGQILNSNCDKIAVENPVNIISGAYIYEYFPDLCSKYGFPIKPTQVIQPYEYGDPYRKKTCLWLKGLDVLEPTEIVEPKLVSYVKSDGSITTFSEDYCRTKGDRAKQRSKTYPGIAKAMADQWG